jgi:hypothetical protein
VRRTLAFLAFAALIPSTSHALSKQGARAGEDSPSTQQSRQLNLTGYLFAGAFIFNPTYAARPNNTGRALARYGLHADLDIYGPWLTLSYDLNLLTDGSPDSSGSGTPSEHDHVIGLLSTIPLPKRLALTVAAHFEIDAPGSEPNTKFRNLHPDCKPNGKLQPPDCYLAGYNQSYLDVYARLGWARGRYSAFFALGGFLYNPTYAARPDNAGIALLRYQLHGEVALLPWLCVRTDLNFFTDRDEFPLAPTEVDVTSEVALRWRAFELRFVGEADLPLGDYPGHGPNPSTTPGLKQFYLATLLQWSFDARKFFTKP